MSGDKPKCDRPHTLLQASNIARPRSDQSCATPQIMPGPQRPGLQISKTAEPSSKKEEVLAREKAKKVPGRGPEEKRSQEEKTRIWERALAHCQERWACYQHEAALKRGASVLTGDQPRSGSVIRHVLSFAYTLVFSLVRAVLSSASVHHTSHRSADRSRDHVASCPEEHRSKSNTHGPLLVSHTGHVFLAWLLLISLSCGAMFAASTQYIDYEVLGYIARAKLTGQDLRCQDIPDMVAIRIQKCLDLVK